MKLVRWIAGAFFMFAATVTPAQAQGDAAGDWHGILASPVGDLTLILSIARDDSGAFAGDMESVDQSPGRRIPLTHIAAADGRLSSRSAPRRSPMRASGWTTKNAGAVFSRRQAPGSR